MDKLRKDFLKSEEGRKWFIEKTIEAVPKDKNWQSFHTPYWFCEKMISKTTLEGKNILVLFNVEFLEVLIHRFNIASKNIIFLADCELELVIAEKIYNVDSILIDINSIEKELKKLKKFDLCFSNPPYGIKSEHFHLRILRNILNICDEIVYLHPVKWAMTINVRETITKNIRKELKGKIKKLDIYHSNIFNEANIPDLLSISHILTNENFECINVKCFGKEYCANIFDDITLYTDSWIPIVKPFMEKIRLFLKYSENIYGIKTSKKYIHWNHLIINEENIPENAQNKNYCYFSGSSRGAIKHLSEENLIQSKLGSVFPIIQVKENNHYIKSYHDTINRKGAYLKYWFDTDVEVINFLNYLRTDFVRFCYSLSKGNSSLYDGALCLIPAMDFTKEWTDNKLYEFFNINQQTIDYITNFFSED